MSELSGRHVAVIGLGQSGLAMARWALLKGARVTVLDDREDPPQREALLAQCPQAMLVAGSLSLAAAGGADLLAWSPGLSPLSGAGASLYRDAMAAGVPVWGEIDFFAAELARLEQQGYRPKVLAITGTNGKTTVTQLAGHLAAEAGIDVQVAGNISPALLDALSQRLADDRLPEIWVLELSSFQLALAGRCSEARLQCTASVVLNISQDHLDWHQTMEHYRESKLRIHRHTACCIVNGDDRQTDPGWQAPATAQPGAAGSAGGSADDAAGGSGGGSGSGTAGGTAGGAAGSAGARRLSKAARPAKTPAGPVAQAAFSLSSPDAGPGFGLMRDGGLTWLAESQRSEHGAAGRRTGAGGAARRAADATGFHLNRLMPVDALRLHGAHNHANALAALTLLRAAGVPMAPMLRGLQGFEAGPHRCRLVAVINDVHYYDDSKGTNVGATVAALSGLDKRCVLIAGGLGKGQDFTPLAPAVRRHARAVVLIGRDAPLIRSALAATGVPLIDALSMQDAVEKAARQAVSGDAVLMSPACASFDMFRDYPHRSEVFNAAVRQLSQEAGQPC